MKRRCVTAELSELGVSAGDPLYNIYVDYLYTGVGGRSAHGLDQYQLKELLEDTRIMDHAQTRGSQVAVARSKALQQRVWDTRGSIAGGQRLQFAGFVELLFEVSRKQQCELHVNVFRVRAGAQLC